MTTRPPPHLPPSPSPALALARLPPLQILLKSNDGVEVEIEKSVASLSKTITNVLEDNPDDDGSVPLANVNGAVLKLIMDYCKKHADAVKKAGVTEEAKLPSEEKAELDKWDKEFANVDQTKLFELILAANYLDIKNLLDLMCMTVANMIKGKDPKEIRETFNIENDFSKEEEEEVRRENQWAFE